MPVLNKELEPHEESASRPARKSMSEVPMVCKTNLLTHSASLPRPARATRLPSLVESQQLQLELRELERSPMVGSSSPRDQPVHHQHNHQTELSTLITLSDQEKLAMSQDQERPPLPPKPSTPSFSNFIIAPQPFRRSDGDPESPSLAQQAIQSWYPNTLSNSPLQNLDCFLFYGVGLQITAWIVVTLILNSSTNYLPRISQFPTLV